MIDTINDLTRQAHQGSVVAIVQLLNYHLTENEVIIRAVFVGEILQLLCEGKQEEDLQKSDLVIQIKEILETVSPRNIRRVGIHSRIFHHHRLLWLEDILDDPDNQLLWSEHITLKRPNIFQRLLGNPSNNLIKDSPSQELREKRQFRRSLLIAGMSLSLLVIVGGFAIYQWVIADYSSVSPTPNATTPDVSDLSDEELFRQAVQLAENAVALGKDAVTEEQWLEIAAQWRQAADLMAAVSPNHPRYTTAQNRVALYLRNQEIALSESENYQ